ncbi:hypothetical protein Tco_0716668 [Tanacetum coccineum]
MYGNIWDNEDVHDLGSVETEFPAIVFNETLTSEATLSCEPTVSYLNNNEIDFRLSFDESDDEDCTIIFYKNSFSYKIISVNNLKTDLENDNDKVNMHLLPSSKPTVSYFDDLDFFKDFENEFPAIVYNDAQTSKSDLLTEPILSPQHIDEFNLKDETSLSECNEEEQNILNFNDIFPFNVIYPDELKTDTDNDNDKVDIEHSLEDLSVKPLPDLINTDVGAYAHGSNKLLEITLDIDDSDHRLTPVVRPSNNPHIVLEITTTTQTLFSSQNNQVDNFVVKPIRIIPGPAGIVQTAKLRKLVDTREGREESVMSTQEYIRKVIEDVDVKEFLKNGKLEKVVEVFKSCTLNALGDLTVTLKDLSGILSGTIPYRGEVCKGDYHRSGFATS